MHHGDQGGDGPVIHSKEIELLKSLNLSEEQLRTLRLNDYFAAANKNNVNSSN